MADKIVKDLSDDFLNCSICMSHFETPKMLPCIHSFCQECLLKYTNTQKGNDIACPTCRKVCTLTESGVKGLQTNFHLVNLAEKVTLLEKLTSPEKKTRVCDSCKHQDVVAFCFDCNFAFCSKCKDQHALFPALRSHSVVFTEDITDPKFQTGWRKATSPFCELHSSEKLNFYCKTCSKLICRDCTIVMHVKPDHEYLDVVTQVGTTKETLTTLLEKSNDNLTKGINYIKRGEKGYETIKKISGDLKNEIAAHCRRRIAELKKMLNEQKDTLIKTVAKVESERIADIKNKLQIAEDWVGRMKNARDVTQHVIQEDNPWELLGMSAELVNAFETLQVEIDELGWCDSQLQQAIMFNPGNLSDIHLGDCNYRAEVVATDPYGNFILCHLEPHDKMLYMCVLIKSSKYTKTERFPPYQWKHEILRGATLHVTAGRQDFLYVALDRVVATFNCKSKECVNQKETYDNSEPRKYISCIAYSPEKNQVLTCANENKFDLWDVDLNRTQYTYASQFRVTFMFPSQYDTLLGSEQLTLHKYSLDGRGCTALNLPPPPDFHAGEILFFEGVRKNMKRYPPRNEFVCFAVWVFVERDEGKPKRWILKEYCTETGKFLGVLDDLGEGNLGIPSALHFESLANDGMTIHLCNSQGKVTSYKRDGKQNNPAPYQIYDPN